MFRKLQILILVALIANLGCVPTAQAQEERREQASQMRILTKQELKRAQQARKLIKSIGTGHHARTKIRLVDKSVLSGYVTESTDDYFELTEDDSGAVKHLEYTQVEKVMLWPTARSAMNQSLSHPRGFLKKVAIGTLIGVGVIAAVCGISRRCED